MCERELRLGGVRSKGERGAIATVPKIARCAAAFSLGRPAQAVSTAEEALVLAILPCLSRDRESSFVSVQ
eukprot:821674-Prymnesium_polylepis.1